MSTHADLADEIRLLAETVLERVEPALRRTAAGAGKPDWDGCGACPICALTALLRGEQHELVTSLAEHGTAIVTILREALAGTPVDPLMPPGSDTGSEQEPAHPTREPARPDAESPAESAPAEEARFVQIPVTIKT